MIKKRWIKVGKNQWKKDNTYIFIYRKFYTRNTAYWDVEKQVNRKRTNIDFRLKNREEAVKSARKYMREH